MEMEIELSGCDPDGSCLHIIFEKPLINKKAIMETLYAFDGSNL